jgi:hypothetical protein
VRVEGAKAIQLHPLVCAAFRAGFGNASDGRYIPALGRGADGKRARAHDEHQQHPLAAADVRSSTRRRTSCSQALLATRRRKFEKGELPRRDTSKFDDKGRATGHLRIWSKRCAWPLRQSLRSCSTPLHQGRVPVTRRGGRSVLDKNGLPQRRVVRDLGRPA